MPIVLNGTTGITTPTYNGNTTAEYLVPVTGFKNRIINGGMEIAQRGTSFTGIGTGNTIAYPSDRFKVSNNDSTSVLSASQLTDAPPGFVNSIRAQVTTVNATPNSETFIEHVIEGDNLTGLAYGTASAQSFTLSFWVKVSVAGQYNVWMYNNSGNKAVGFSFTVSSPNTWTQVSATIAGDTAAAFSSDNSPGIYIRWYLDVGNAAIGTLPSTWSSSTSIRMATGSVRFCSTLNATYQITGVQFEVGSTATSFDYRPYGTELALCQRYFEVFGGGGVGVSRNGTTIGVTLNYSYRVTKRTDPTIRFVSNFNVNAPANNSWTVTALNGTNISTVSGCQLDLTTSTSTTTLGTVIMQYGIDGLSATSEF